MGMFPAGADLGVVVAITGFLLVIMRIVVNSSRRMTFIMRARIQKQMDLRKAVHDSFRNKNGYSWDLVLIFNVHLATDKLSDAQKKNSMKNILNSIADGGIETKLFYSVSRKLIFCKLRADYERLKKEADRSNYKLELDPMATSSSLATGKTENGDKVIWRPIRLPLKSEETDYDPCMYLFAPFRFDTRYQYLYKRYDGDTLFRGVDRLKLLRSILMASRFDGGCGLDIGKLEFENCLAGHFALHDMVELRILEEKWLHLCQLPWAMPINQVKDYYGEKIGFYFLWLSHYCSWLLGAAGMGLIAWSVTTAEDEADSSGMPYFAAAIAVWSGLLMEQWRRKQKRYAMEWGMVGFESETLPRPQFHGEDKPDPVRGHNYKFFSKGAHLCRVLQSSTVILAAILVVIGVVTSIFVIRLSLQGARDLNILGMDQSNNVASVANVVQIQVLNKLYGGLAVFLTDWENHRTESQYEDALINKTFVFQFINSFAALFYTGIVKGLIPQYDSCNHSCIDELSNMLFVILAGNLLTSNISEIGVPAFFQWYQKRQERSKTEYEYDDVGLIERMSFRDTYDVTMGPYADYSELMMQFGYTTMFVAAFPLATVMSFAANYVEIRVDSWKLCHLCRRPDPVGCEDIGIWEAILEVMSHMAIVTNAALVAYTSRNTVNYPWHTRNFIFLGMVVSVAILRALIVYLIPDIPRDVRIQLQRQNYILSKVLYDAQDEVESDYLTEALKAEYVVRVIDDDPL